MFKKVKESFKNCNTYEFDNYVMVAGKFDTYFMKVSAGYGQRTYCVIITEHGNSDNVLYRGTCSRSLDFVIAEAQKMLTKLK